MEDNDNTETAIEPAESPDNGLADLAPIQDTNTDIEALTEAQSKCPVTLAHIRKNKPRLLNLAIQMLSNGISQRQTSEATSLSRQVIAQIMIQHEEQIGDARESAAKQARNVAKQTLDLMQERIEEGEISPNLLPVYFGVLTEKAELLTGQATQRTEHKHTTEDFIDIDTFYKEQQANKAKQSAIDVTPQ